jgi:hypothetical protein
MNVSRVPPPWVWSDLRGAALTQAWEELGSWVSWLEEAYAPWIVLPDCWPLHEGLCVEIRIFYYWHEYLTTHALPAVESLRWHSELRSASRQWQALAQCVHEDAAPHVLDMRRQRLQVRRRYLDQARARTAEGAS